MEWVAQVVWADRFQATVVQVAWLAWAEPGDSAEPEQLEPTGYFREKPVAREVMVAWQETAEPEAWVVSEVWPSMAWREHPEPMEMAEVEDSAA